MNPKRKQIITNDMDSVYDKTMLTRENTTESNTSMQSLQNPYLFIHEACDIDKKTLDFSMSTGNKTENNLITGKAYRDFETFPFHYHDYIEIMFVLSGEVHNDVENLNITYSAGQCMIMNRYIRHQERFKKSFDTVFLELSDSFLTELLQGIEQEHHTERQRQLSAFISMLLTQENTGNTAKTYWSFTPRSSQLLQTQLKPVLDEAFQVLQEPTPGYSYHIKSIILQILSLLGDPESYMCNTTSATFTKQEDLYERIRQILSVNHGHVRAEDLEAALHYNREYLTRITKKMCGKTITQLGKEIRMRDTRRLLETTDNSIEEIMEELKVTSRGQFYAQFKERYGMTPEEYRRSHLSQ